MAKTDSQRQTNALAAQQKPSQEFVEALGMELAILAETFQTQVTELMTIGFSEALKDLPFQVIRLGFRRALRSSKYIPKPIEIREWGLDEWQKQRPQYQPIKAAPESELQLEQDKETWAKLCSEFHWTK